MKGRKRVREKLKGISGIRGVTPLSQSEQRALHILGYGEFLDRKEVEGRIPTVVYKDGALHLVTQKGMLAMEQAVSSSSHSPTSESKAFWDLSAEERTAFQNPTEKAFWRRMRQEQQNYLAERLASELPKEEVKPAKRKRR